MMVRERAGDSAFGIEYSLTCRYSRYHMRIEMVSLVPLLLSVTTIFAATLDQYELEKKIETDIKRHKVMLYSKTYCPYSRKIKVILKKYDIDDMKTVELNLEEQMSDMQDFLRTLSGRRTVPQLFVDGRFIGGHDDTKELDDNGELEKILMKAGAIPHRNEKEKEHRNLDKTD